MTPSPRNIEIDTIGTFALIGICIVNNPSLGLTATQKLAPSAALAERAPALPSGRCFRASPF
jgi:hypothetical protein